MTDKKITDRIYRKIDGELTAEEQRELEIQLSGHPESAQFEKQWESVKNQITQEKNELVDIDLKQEILKRINMETYKQPHHKAEILVVRSFWSRPIIKFGFTFVLGIFTGFLIFSALKVDFFGKDTPAAEEVVGSFYDSRSFDKMKVADVLQYESALTKAVCNVRYSTKIVEIRVDFSSLDPIKSTIEFDYNNFTVLNLQNLSVNDQSTAIAAGNFIQFNNVGENKFVIQLYNKNSLPHNIEFKIYQNDSPIYQNSVQVNKE